ncbi:MAG: sigma-70 family RNA polymerase sigma factor [Kofleriaceae bacterium]
MAAFPATPRSILEDLQSGDERRKARARDRLAEQYWTPIYAYVRFRWRLEPDRAAEATQELFLRDLEREMFSRFDPERARLRTFLRTCADNVVRDRARLDHAVKRGAAHAVPLEVAERAMAALNGSLSPDEAFEQAWRARVLAITRQRLDASLRGRGKAAHAEIFAMVHDEDPAPSYAEIAARLGVTVVDVTNWLHVARREWRTQFSLVLHEGGINPADLAEELARRPESRGA